MALTIRKTSFSSKKATFEFSDGLIFYKVALKTGYLDYIIYIIDLLLYDTDST